MSQLRIGVEEEFMLLDAENLELSNDTSAFLKEAEEDLPDNVKAEFHASVVEIVTDPCSSVDEALAQLKRHRRSVIDLAKNHGLLVAAAGTHPTTHWKDVKITEGARYTRILDNLQDLARANLIYGMHCHVEILEHDARIHVMNAARFFLPHLLALSTSSPFWQGKPTGHMSTRNHVFKRFPRTGVPDYYGDFAEYARFVDLLVETNTIDNAKMIYWDIRPHPFYPTVEFRICDTPTRVRETIAIVAVLQAIVHKLLALYRNNLGYRLFRRALIAENVYRAARWGLEGDLIDFQARREVSTRKAIEELLEFLEPDFCALGTLEHTSVVEDMLKHGNSARRQLDCYAETQDATDVIRLLVKDTEVGLED